MTQSENQQMQSEDMLAFIQTNKVNIEQWEQSYFKQVAECDELRTKVMEYKTKAKKAKQAQKDRVAVETQTLIGASFFNQPRRDASVRKS